MSTQRLPITEAGITFIATTLLMFTYFMLIVLRLADQRGDNAFFFPLHNKKKDFLRFSSDTQHHRSHPWSDLFFKVFLFLRK